MTQLSIQADSYLEWAARLVLASEKLAAEGKDTKRVDNLAKQATIKAKLLLA